jgi:hypothetical protein
MVLRRKSRKEAWLRVVGRVILWAQALLRRDDADGSKWKKKTVVI